MLKELPPWFAEQRSAGCLLHISSLPSSFGIGNLGKSSYRFIDFLKESGFSFWQVCPVGPTGFGDSPYQVFSSSAGNPYFIDWEPLLENNLISHDELDALSKLPHEFVDYGNLYNSFFLQLVLHIHDFIKIVKFSRIFMDPMIIYGGLNLLGYILMPVFSA